MGPVNNRVISVASATGRGLPSRGARSLARLAQQYWAAFRRENAHRIAVLAALLLLSGAAVIFMVEQGETERNITSLAEALWYGIVTMTTVGYGDFTPRTWAGRAAAVVLMLGGMGLISLYSGTIASILVASKIKKARGLEVIDRMKNHVLVCGWNQHAERVLEGLLVPTQQVALVNELPEESINEILLRYRGQNLEFVRGDPAVESVLVRANARHAEAAVVLADTSRDAGAASDERTILVTLALKSLNATVTVTAEALDMKSEAHLRRAGADNIVVTGEFNGFLLSSTALVPGLAHVVRSLLTRTGGELRCEPIPSELVGRSFGELFQALRSRQGFLTLAIVSENKGLALDDLLTDNSSLIDQFIKQQFREAGMDHLRFEKGSLRVLVNPDDSYEVGACDMAIGIPRVG